MQLFSIQFFLFVVILFILYYTVLKKVQWACLLAGSLVFFCMFGVQNLIYILITSFSIWLGAKGLDAIVQKYNQDRKREGITKEDLGVSMFTPSKDSSTHLTWWLKEGAEPEKYFECDYLKGE